MLEQIEELCRPLAFAKSECLSWFRLINEKQKLEREDVHVWLARLDVSIERYINLLDTNEIEQAERYPSVLHRNRYIVTRGWLRVILSRYLQVKPEYLRFFANEHGKPFLAFPGGAQAVNFNLSHSSGLALFAVAHRERRIGIDLEKIRTITSVDRIAGKFFPAEECAALEVMCEPLKTRSFLHSWTRLEAYGKAMGMGLSVAAKERKILLSGKIPGQAGENLEKFPWSINNWEPAPEFIAAFAVEGNDWRFRYRELEE